jgi:hypothetical protein
VLLVVLIVVVCVVATTAILYLAVPPVRRFIRKDRPIWWVGDLFIAVVVAILVLVGQSYLTNTGARDQATSQSPQGEAQRLEDLRFVRDTSSLSYQPRPFRQFLLAGMNLANLQLKGVNFVQADLTGANLAGADLSSQGATPVAAGVPAFAGQSTLLQGANLCHAVLTGTNLSNAYLVNANLAGVDLTTTTLNGAVLNGADLSGANLPGDSAGKDRFLKGIYYDGGTIWPTDFQPPKPGTEDKFKFLSDPSARALYGDIPRPTCHS